MAAHRSGDSRRLDPLSGRFTDYIVIDTETTGLSVRKGAKLIEIGAVKIVKSWMSLHAGVRTQPWSWRTMRPSTCRSSTMLYSSLTRSETRALRTISSTLWTSAVDCIRKNEATKFPPSSSTTTSPTWRSTAHCPTPGRSGCCTAPCVTRPSCSACSDSLTSFEHFDPVFSHRCLLICGWIICSASCRSRRHLHWRRTLHWVRSSERNRSVGGRRWLNRIWRHS